MIAVAIALAVALAGVLVGDWSGLGGNAHDEGTIRGRGTNGRQTGSTEQGASGGLGPERVEAESASTKSPWRDVTDAWDIDFVHHHGGQYRSGRGSKRLPESMGAGSAILDYDNDGRQDILLINGADWPDAEPSKRPPSRPALLRNTGTRFVDVTLAAGLDVTHYGMGVACGDFDNDGWVDVFLTSVGENRLFQNIEGTFVEVTQQAGVSGTSDQWGTSCAWLDYDNDGDLDLYVCRYLDWDVERDAAQRCRLPDGTAAYCPPSVFPGAAPLLYRNDGNGTFTERAADAGLDIRTPAGQPLPKALGVAPVDLDEDGWIDLVVANDTVRNLVFHNQRDGTFRELGVPAGIAFDPLGDARGAMGIDAADVRNDSSLAVAIGNFSDEMAAVYLTRGSSLQFDDVTRSSGVGARTLESLTFGLLWLDFDLDGRLDLFLANGHLEPDIARVDPTQTYRQRPQLFRNVSDSSRLRLAPVQPSPANADLFRPLVGRAAAYGDIDSDGDLDLLLTACGGRPRLLRNDLPARHARLRFKLIGRNTNRDAIGSWVRVETDAETIRRRVMPTRGYLSQVELPVTIGLEADREVRSIEVHWADGTIQPLDHWRPDRTNLVVERPQRGT